MTTALFVYRRKVTVNKEDRYNENYINPLNVISFYWSDNDEQKQILSVFLTNNYTITFGETVGRRFTDHMEDFLRFVLGWGKAYIQPAVNTQTENRPRHSRKALTADIVEEEMLPPAVEWADPNKPM